jgi:hypothetical protein
MPSSRRQAGAVPRVEDLNPVAIRVLDERQALHLAVVGPLDKVHAQPETAAAGLGWGGYSGFEMLPAAGLVPACQCASVPVWPVSSCAQSAAVQHTQSAAAPLTPQSARWRPPRQAPPARCGQSHAGRCCRCGSPCTPGRSQCPAAQQGRARPSVRALMHSQLRGSLA